MLDTIARHGIWPPIWLFAFAFTDAVLGGIYRASDGADIAGFVPSSIFSAIVVVFAVFTMQAVKAGDRHALWWAALALVAGALRGFASNIAPGTLGDYGMIVFTLSVVCFVAVAIVRWKATHSPQD